MQKESGFIWKLGMFVTIGIAILLVTVYLVGKQKNIFGSTFLMKTFFQSVSGLKEGNNVRFSGINIGTVDRIVFVNDSSVLVEMVVRKNVQEFIHKDAKASIGSDGLMGDKVLTISSGKSKSASIVDGDAIESIKATEMQDIMNSLKTSVDNAAIITKELAGFTYKINNGKGALSKLISDDVYAASLGATLINLENSSEEFAVFTKKMNDGKGALSKLVSDESFANSLDTTMTNLKTGSKSLSENMEAAKSNFLLKGYFNKKKRADEKAEKIRQEKINQQKKLLKDSGAQITKDSLVNNQ